MKITIQSPIWIELSNSAWKVRNNAFILGNTSVGASLYTLKGNIHSGCNVEHKFRSHDIHAEINAISTMISNGEYSFTHLLVVANRELFTPCGSCMDWIMQFGSLDCLIGFQSTNNSTIKIYKTSELMPFYPR